MHHDKGEYDQAIAYYQQALESKLRSLGEDHPHVATRRDNTGCAYYALGQFPKALAQLEQAACILLNKLGEQHPNTQTCLSGLKDCKAKLAELESTARE